MVLILQHHQYTKVCLRFISSKRRIEKDLDENIRGWGGKYFPEKVFFKRSKNCIHSDLKRLGRIMVHQFNRKTQRVLKKYIGSGSRGFSLIELIAVIIIMGILTNVVRVQVRDTSQNTKIFNAAQTALADLRYAQESAMNNKRAVRFVVQSGNNRYYAQYIDNGSYVLDSRGQSLNVVLTGDNYTGVTIRSSETGANLTFSSTGRPDEDGSGNYFTSSVVINLNNIFEVIVIGSGMTALNNIGGGGGCGC
jgi:prepilin-type N-terminal cleavage/methylation domain-containing protein